MVNPEQLRPGDVFTTPGLPPGDALLVTRTWGTNGQAWIQVQRADGRGEPRQILAPPEATLVRRMEIVFHWVPVNP